MTYRKCYTVLTKLTLWVEVLNDTDNAEVKDEIAYCLDRIRDEGFTFSPSFELLGDPVEEKETHGT